VGNYGEKLRKFRLLIRGKSRYNFLEILVDFCRLKEALIGKDGVLKRVLGSSKKT
jgi:hypothetical protein